MAFQLEDINFKTVADPKGFIEEGDQAYKDRVAKAADKIISNRDKSPIVLLSGPSGSSKTTTSMKIAEELNRRGIGTHYIGMDDYFKTIDENSPRTPEGELDLESPLCLDMELMNRHFDMLSKGERIYVPKYEFSRRMGSHPLQVHPAQEGRGRHRRGHPCSERHDNERAPRSLQALYLCAQRCALRRPRSLQAHMVPSCAAHGQGL